MPGVKCTGTSVIYNSTKVIGITESCREGKSEGNINLEGFIPYRDDRGRVVILTMDFESSAWSIITQ